MKQFVGRTHELTQLSDLLRKKTSSLLTIQGQRRIGKSTLIREFCRRSNIPCFEFQGLPPREGLTPQDQINEFSERITKYIQAPSQKFKRWSDALEYLNLLCLKQASLRTKYVVLLDEISWMAIHSPDFPGYLKDAWDRYLSTHQNLILVLCGSVSSWIQKNILKNTAFVGRVSRQFILKELSISESATLIKQSLKKASSREIAEILAVTGGVPKYLEEFSPYKSIDTAIQELFYTQTGFLFHEFDAIFSDIFGKKSEYYKDILKTLVGGPLTPAELAEKINHPLNGDWSDLISDLELAGFVRRDFNWNFKGGVSKQSQLRLHDVYTKYYLKYVEPNKQRILKHTGSKSPAHWPNIFGLQFETLIISNVTKLINLARIPTEEIMNLGPFFQTATKAKEGVQIDFMVQCRKGIIHIFEIKTGSKLGVEVERQVKIKSKNLKLPRGYALRHYLVYLGEVSEDLRESDYFDKFISFEDFLV